MGIPGVPLGRVYQRIVKSAESPVRSSPVSIALCSMTTVQQPAADVIVTVPPPGAIVRTVLGDGFRNVVAIQCSLPATVTSTEVPTGHVQFVVERTHAVEVATGRQDLLVGVIWSLSDRLELQFDCHRLFVWWWVWILLVDFLKFPRFPTARTVRPTRLFCPRLLGW